MGWLTDSLLYDSVAGFNDSMYKQQLEERKELVHKP